MSGEPRGEGEGARVDREEVEDRVVYGDGEGVGGEEEGVEGEKREEWEGEAGVFVGGYVGMGGIGKLDGREVGKEEGKFETLDDKGGEEGFSENVDDVDAGADDDDDANDFLKTVNVDDELME